MRGTKLTVTVLVAALAATGVAFAELELPRVSPKATVSQTVGTTLVAVDYSRPGVKGRVIWGELVPYGEVWRTGANEATTFTVSDDVTIAGKPLAAGTYSLATIPGKDGWTVIFNRELALWGMYDYKPEQDVLRVTVKPATGPMVEWMRFTFENLGDDSATVVLAWETLRIAFEVKVDVVATTLAKARKEIAAAASDDWRTSYMAASFCFQKKVAMDEAEGWLSSSLAVKETAQNLGLKARFQAGNGDVAGAIATMKKAIAAGKASGANTAALERALAEWEAGTK